MSDIGATTPKPVKPILKRRGARALGLVTEEIIRRLESGDEESANHIEQMAIDMPTLLRAVLPGLGARADVAGHGGFLTRMRSAAELAYSELGDDLISVAGGWKSDTARGWAAFAVALKAEATTADRVALLLPFADDPHFAVREWAWLSLRPTVVSEPADTIAALAPLTGHSSFRLRRFVSEATRPRGVWSAHVPLLKREPWHAAGLLEDLAHDDERYVQNSVGNWVNDAAKTASSWAASTCTRWRAEGVAPLILVRAERWLTLRQRCEAV